MLSKADDYPIHQLPEPVATAGTDRNFYDRYFFNGSSPDGSLFFAVALGVYPHLNVMDAAISIVEDGVQHNLRASRLLKLERMDTAVGPIVIEVLEPLQSLRIRVAPNGHGIEADLVFHARLAPIAEPRFTYRIGPRTIMDYTRMTQSGGYDGWLQVQGRRHILTRQNVWGTRDRSWGVRPVGAPDSQPVAPPPVPQFYWLWAPLNFSQAATFYHRNADAEGRAWNTAGVFASLSGEPPVHYSDVCSDIAYKPGTRHARAATIRMQSRDLGDVRLTLTSHWNFSMMGVGYMHPQWGHGHYKGELASAYDSFALADVKPGDVLHQHVQAFVTAELEGPKGLRQSGRGVLEQLVIGAYTPHGLKGIFDPAP